MYLRRGLCKLIQNFVSNPLDFLSLKYVQLYNGDIIVTCTAQ